ncbi:hypothetical protein BU23DRAFT_578853 [Bimuria novae-zelandiae CBS 107.79]|uniref:Uncharacterized protein n=1 Tax=Bimuria novae-zelandiae CBS 107.79 TaxID=1447943 RepID=A0A6A5VJZ6_9PLEO|nr:hypothetical protein BU23DRAFT_578853 [Bimuria novae-zelandiae CBS 107.79]
MKKPEFKIPSVLGKISAKFVKKPVFNQPVDTERRYHVTRILFAVLLSLLIATATAVIGLRAITINFIEDNRDTGFEYKAENPNDSVIVAALPRTLYTAPAKLALIAGGISIFVGASHLAFVIMDWKVGKKTQAYAFRRNMMFLHFFNTVLILFALISIFVTHKSSSHVNVRYIELKSDRISPTDGMRYNIGKFDLETWSCGWVPIPGATMVHDDYDAQCRVEVAGRAMMVLFLVLGMGLAGLSIWSMLGGRDINGERIKTEEVGVEMDRMNAV